MTFDASGVSRTTIPTVEFNSCRQRVSIVHNARGEGTVSAVRGRITGCSVSEDWWVRAMPMSDVSIGPSRYEGILDEAGNFELIAVMPGIRHFLVIGKGRTPLKAIGFDVSEGGSTDLGSLDL
ncbi:MAG: hypothetical protein SFV51_21370 [Bryobacteraceae bacterium]|nr:hypothetical protein [Bryobacteraceae bacterium]